MRTSPILQGICRSKCPSATKLDCQYQHPRVEVFEPVYTDPQIDSGTGVQYTVKMGVYLSILISGSMDRAAPCQAAKVDAPRDPMGFRSVWDGRR